MANNLYFERVGQLLDEESLLPETSVLRKENGVSRKSTLAYLTLQSLMLGIIWTLKSHKVYALLFPGCVALLMATRHFLLPRVFSKNELALLDPDDE
jgi:hypothetical protein